MLRKPFVTLAAATMLMASAPREAQAICGGSSFSTCATVGIIKALLPNGQVQLLVAVANLTALGSNPTSFTSIGVWGLPSSAQYVNNSLFVIGLNAGSWQLGPTGLAASGLSGGVFGVQATGGGLGPLGAALFGFRLTGISLAQINTLNWAIYGDNGSGCGTTLVSTNGVANSGGYSPTCVPTTPNVTPEPATVILLASGLAGLGGVALTRRRKRLS